MPDWSQGYRGRLQKLHQRPVYAIMLLKGIAQLKSGITASSNITIDGDEVITIDTMGNDDVIIWDQNYVEMASIDKAVTTTDQTLTPRTRGDYGTNAYAFADDASVGAILDIFTTGTVTGLTRDYRNGWSEFPSGGGCSIDVVNGRSNSAAVRVRIQDRQNRITKLLQQSPIIGQYAIVFGGYEGLGWNHYAMLHVGKITQAEIDGVSYDFEIGSVEDRMNKRLFEWVEDFSTTTTGSMTSVQTTLPIDVTLLPTGGDHETEDDPYYAALFAKIDSEYMRIQGRSGGGANIVIARGQLGTTAATHSSGATVDLVFAVEDNPIDIILGMMLTRDPDYPQSSADDATAHDYSWYLVGLNGGSPYGTEETPIGCGFLDVEIDISSFETVRNDWFPSYIGRLVIDRRESIKPIIEGILKEYHLNIAPGRTGRLKLIHIRPNVGSTTELTENEIMGVPRIRLDHSEIVNDVTIKLDYDPASHDYDTTTRVLDEESQVTYGTVGATEMNSRTLVTAHNGDVIAPRLGRRKKRYHRVPNPVLPLEVLYTSAHLDIGDVALITHPGIVDVNAGVRGITAKPMAIIGRYPDWQRGRMEFEFLDPGFYGNRYGLIAPSGQADYDAASADDKANYAFIGAATTNLMLDGTPGYNIQ